MKGKAIISCEPGQPSAKQHVQSTMEVAWGDSDVDDLFFADSPVHARIYLNLQFSTHQEGIDKRDSFGFTWEPFFSPLNVIKIITDVCLRILL